MTDPPELPARFRPLRPLVRPRFALWVLAGAVIWLVALVVLAFVIGSSDAVELALLVLGASFAVGLVGFGLARVQRVRTERST
jgi:membrane protein DedA with SNARE-associated domain